MAIRTRLRTIVVLLGFAAFGVYVPRHCAALGPNDPEVQEVVRKALENLQNEPDDQLGAWCLVSLAHLKTGSPLTHRKVRSGLLKCQQASRQPAPISDVYSNGLAVILLCEADSQAYRREIERYLASLYARQKAHGGWGYEHRPTGDTSQTQYAVLALWSAHRAGFRIKGESVVAALQWLLSTQDPSGVWGYQGRVAESARLAKQTGISNSMLAAGLGSTLMCADMLGLVAGSPQDDQAEQPLQNLPDAVRRTGQEKQILPVAGGGRISQRRLKEAIAMAQEWMRENYTVDVSNYNYYYLYSIERYKSFEEAAGDSAYIANWYEDGFEFLRENQFKSGGWNHGCGISSDTSFGILFLIRSTQRSIQKSGIGDGLLVGGRGLPANIAQATVRRGRLMAPQETKTASEVIKILDNPDDPQYERLISEIQGEIITQIGEVTEKDVPRLQRLIRGGDPASRMIATRLLARRRNLDDVPLLLFALTDPDRRVVLAARDGLRFISRRLEGFGLSDEYTKQQLFDAMDQWRVWYLSIRPDALVTN